GLLHHPAVSRTLVCGRVRAAAHERTRRTRRRRDCSMFSAISGGGRLAPGANVIWFFEKDTDLVVCEIRRAEDDESSFEFEIADSQGPKTQRFSSPTELIANYLIAQAQLMRAGWRPSKGDIAMLE